MMKSASAIFLTALLITSNGIAQTISFGDDELLSIEFIEIGNPGNADDPRVQTADIPDAPSTFPEPNPSGGVDYVYGISKFEVSLSQFSDVNDLIDIGYDLEQALEVLASNGVENVPRPEMPAITSWNDAAHFVNWLNVSLGYASAYEFEFSPEHGYGPIRLLNVSDQGFNPNNPFRNGMARFVLPSLDEWHKAAFYDPDKGSSGGYWLYTSGSDEQPTPVASGVEVGTAVFNQPRPQGPADVTEAGGPSPYGVNGMGGNLGEWMEGTFDGKNDDPFGYRDRRGGAWLSTRAYSADRSPQASPDSERFADTFRVVDLGEIPAGDFNGDRVFTPRDINELVDAINSPEPSDFYDLNGDGSVNADDRTFWIEELANVTYGDADMNGEVDFSDFLALSGAFETDGGWAGGDFDGSGLTDFDDFLTLSGNFGQTESTAVASVPEPSSVSLASLSLLALGVLLRQRR